MTKKQTNQSILLAGILIAIAAISRLLPHPANFAPISAMALMGGAYFGRHWMKFLIPFAALFISDFILNNTVLRAFYPDHEGLVFFSQYMLYNYLSFGIIVCIGIVALRKVRISNLIVASLSSSLLFFLLTNFGSWKSQMLGDISLLVTYEMGLPFFRATVLGDLIYSFIGFGALETFRRRISAGNLNKA